MTRGIKTISVALLQNPQVRATSLAALLIVFYCAPLYLGLAALWSSDSMQESSTSLKWFAAYLMSSDSTLSEFHKVLMPAMSAISVAAYVKRPTLGMVALAVFVFASWMVAVWTSVWFDMGEVRSGLKGLSSGLTVESAKLFLGRIRETLLMYFMMLVGLQVANREEQPAVKE